MNWNNNHNVKPKSPIKNRSPCKQNQSPSKFALQKGFSQTQMVEKLVNYLTEHGIQVPSQLLEKMRDLAQMSPNKRNQVKQKGLADSFIKIQKVSSAMPQISLIPSARSLRKQDQRSHTQLQEKQTVRRLQVKLNDYQFELKKVNQDFAEFKVLSRLDKQKEVRKFRQLYEETQKKLRAQNQNWQNRFKIREQQYRDEVRAFKQQKQKQVVQEVANLVKQKQHIYCQKIEKLTKQNQTLKEQLQQQKQRMQQIKQAEIQKIKFIYETKIVEVVKQKETQKELKVREKQKQIMEAQLIKEKAKADYKELQESTNKLKEKLYHDIYIARRENSQQQEKIQQFKKEKQALEYQIKQKNKELSETKAAHIAAQHFIEENKQKVIKVIRQDTKKEIQAILHKNAQVVRDFTERIQELEYCKQEMERLRKISQQQVSKKYLQRPSRDEDVTKIQKLHYDVMFRDEELRKTKLELKKTRLEQQNNQKVYNRIFSGQTKHVDKKSLTKEDKSLIVKGGQTLDMRNLLKICLSKHL